MKNKIGKTIITIIIFGGYGIVLAWWLMALCR